MTSEPEAEVSDVASAISAAQSASDSGVAGTLLEVTFQKNPHQKHKYLEAEPKILGMTEIALSFFFIGCRIPSYLGESIERIVNSVLIAFSCVGIIAGSVAIAAQKLHLPTLKACLGMQVVTCVTYAFCLMFTNNNLHPGNCWYYYNYNETIHENSTCLLLEDGYTQMTLLNQLIGVTQIALSATLAAYCCKVIQCCSPRSHVPVIMMTPPTTAQ